MEAKDASAIFDTIQFRLEEADEKIITRLMIVLGETEFIKLVDSEVLDLKTQLCVYLYVLSQLYFTNTGFYNAENKQIDYSADVLDIVSKANTFIISDARIHQKILRRVGKLLVVVYGWQTSDDNTYIKKYN